METGDLGFLVSDPTPMSVGVYNLLQISNNRHLLFPNAIQLADCRKHLSKVNRLFNYGVNKRGNSSIILVIPEFGDLDKMLRDITDLVIRP